MKKHTYFAILLMFVSPCNAFALTPYFATGVTTGIQNSGRHAATAYKTLWTITGGLRYGLTDNLSMRNEIEYATSNYTFESGIYEYDTRTQIFLGNKQNRICLFATLF